MACEELTMLGLQYLAFMHAMHADRFAQKERGHGCCFYIVQNAEKLRRDVALALADENSMIGTSVYFKWLSEHEIRQAAVSDEVKRGIVEYDLEREYSTALMVDSKIIIVIKRDRENMPLIDVSVTQI